MHLLGLQDDELHCGTFIGKITGQFFPRLFLNLLFKNLKMCFNQLPSYLPVKFHVFYNPVAHLETSLLIKECRLADWSLCELQVNGIWRKCRRSI